MSDERAAPPLRQIAMVMDLNKCLGCQTCTVACKKLWNRDPGAAHVYWNSVETAPGAGYPRGWQSSGGRGPEGTIQKGALPALDTDYGRSWSFNHAAVIHSDSNRGKTWLRPDGDPKWGPNWDEDHGAGHYPESNHYFYLPRICNHCTHPACLDACPRAAIEKRAADGIVVVNQDRCHGYRFCVEACPYKKAYFDAERQVANKCIFCLPRLEQGVAPACARQCPGRLRFVGYLDDEAGPIWKLVEKWRVALPLHPEYGLAPNVFYVPPQAPPALDAAGRPTGEPRIPPAYLESLFGSRVHEALATLAAERERRRRGEASELMDLLIARDWRQSFALGGDPLSRAEPDGSSRS
jgi:DMSO reductase family type II enzyme iron-sulfur subunit